MFRVSRFYRKVHDLSSICWTNPDGLQKEAEFKQLASRIEATKRFETSYNCKAMIIGFRYLNYCRL